MVIIIVLKFFNLLHLHFRKIFQGIITTILLIDEFSIYSSYSSTIPIQHPLFKFRISRLLISFHAGEMNRIFLESSLTPSFCKLLSLYLSSLILCLIKEKGERRKGWYIRNGKRTEVRKRGWIFYSYFFICVRNETLQTKNLFPQ